ncbi:unnamed protein product, partial [marine sediment metagenome]
TIKIYGEKKNMSTIGGMVNKTVMGVITAVIFVLIGVALGPTVIASVADINASALSGIPLANVIVLLGTYLPAFYYLAIVLGGIAMVWAATKSGGK